MIRRRMVLASAWLVVILGAAAGSCGPVSEDSAPARQPIRTVGVATDLPGLGKYNGYDRTGFETDLYIWLAAHADHQFTAVPTPLPIADRDNAIREGRAQMVVDVYSITDARRKSVAFAGPYLITKQSAMTRKGDPAIRKFGDLSGKNVCVPSGSTSLYQLRNSSLAGKIILTEHEASQDCVTDLLAGQVDVVSMDQLILLGYQHKDPDHLSVDLGMKFGADERYGVGVPRSDVAFCEELVKGLKGFITDGQWLQDFQANFGDIDSTLFKPDVDRLDSCQPPDIP
jgi:glutamate transport system substrate-binding protein